MSKAILLVISLFFLGGCTSLGERRVPAPVEEVGSRPEPPPIEVGPPVLSEEEQERLRREPLPPAPQPVVPPEPPAPTASSTLLAEVDQAIAANQLDRAAALCERALRITPRDGLLWYKLATIRYLQGRHADARGFAQRALSLAGSNAQLVRDGNDLLERIRVETAD
jgi:tetratricopeptide (TPR) repeat protein